MQPMHGETTSILTQAKHSKAPAVQLKHCVEVHVSICGIKKKNVRVNVEAQVA